MSASGPSGPLVIHIDLKVANLFLMDLYFDFFLCKKELVSRKGNKMAYLVLIVSQDF